ncbi:aminotransferase class I/II-fold pyridoxal phosphate-dependent enzyme [Candidatus Aalborgicola defluviihabitans]|uniref:aminotransferase class I/II-fold pyridoxal phosphate-dependent enzyme n=1 Tax=Candidatus Aalborgicola defluviihabitans TaxID=3386187 RepID=UPI001D825F6C|nr:aminotransferase class I/II-fold pyridoxal phosphate-dependent enzyme [Burkholderiales bacterium]
MSATEPMLQPIHGGPDAQGVPRFDFSTNSNACGPCPQALAAVQQADATRYPDPAYALLRQALAAFHGVNPERVLLAASASECIHRISALVARQGGRGVRLPAHHYGDYAHAAQVWGLQPVQSPQQAALLWACEPSSPLGQADAGLSDSVQALQPNQTLVLDCAYAPLRLGGEPSLSASQRDQVWQLFTPNKALGLTGVRAAYVIAPYVALTRATGQMSSNVSAFSALSSSWPVGAHGVALLQAWVQPNVQQWLCDSLQVLRGWKARQMNLLQSLGWVCQPSDANFFCAKPVLSDGVGISQWLADLRGQGIKLRDATSFGLPGWVRLGVLEPAAQDALAQALQGLDSRQAQSPRYHASVNVSQTHLINVPENSFS